MLGIRTASSGADHTHELQIYPTTFIDGIDAVWATSPGGVDQHDHFVLITAADIVSLKAGGEVRKKTCSGTDHEYMLKCMGPASPPSLPNDCTDECGGTPNDLCP